MKGDNKIWREGRRDRDERREERVEVLVCWEAGHSTRVKVDRGCGGTLKNILRGV